MTAYLTSRALFTVVALSTLASAQTAPAPASPTAPCSTSNQPQNQSAQTSKPCAPPASGAAQPPAAEQFPFPGEPAKPVPPPDAPGDKAPPSGAAADHPFPTTRPPRLPGSDSNSSSSGSGGEDPDSTPNLPPGSEGTSVHRKLPKVARVQTDDERVDEDINVAKFYMNDENFQGAYLRAQDAVKTQPDYSLAHFTLAQVAQKMKKKDEAIAEFNTYLKLDPEGEKRKEAQRALEALK